MKYPYDDITRVIIGAFYDVYNALGPGFLEKVYENALLIELGARGLKVHSQYPVTVHYKGQNVGEYMADIIVEDNIICEVKAIQKLRPEHEAQLLNYLKATEIKIGLLLNFGPKPQVKRRIF
jgi:GxxExxY protein